MIVRPTCMVDVKVSSVQKWNKNLAALPVHRFSHCLNLCLQDVGTQIAPLRDALDVVKEISKEKGTAYS